MSVTCVRLEMKQTNNQIFSFCVIQKWGTQEQLTDTWGLFLVLQVYVWSSLGESVIFLANIALSGLSLSFFGINI